jgi:hypothetical protein
VTCHSSSMNHPAGYGGDEETSFFILISCFKCFDRDKLVDGVYGAGIVLLHCCSRIPTRYFERGREELINVKGRAHGQFSMRRSLVKS